MWTRSPGRKDVAHGRCCSEVEPQNHIEIAPIDDSIDDGLDEDI